MKDRTPRYPGRVRLNPVAGAENTFDLLRADEPVEEGTPLNKQTLLTDETAYLLELKVDDPTPDDAFSHIARNFTGDGGMNINLLEEAIHMKYCKVLAREEQRSGVADFFANSIVQTGYESDDGKIQALACIEGAISNQLRIRTINRTTGKVFNSVIPLYGDVYKYSLTGATTPGSGLYANFTGWFHFTPVKNKPNEVMLKIYGDLLRYHYESSNAYQYRLSMRMVHILDVTTGEVKAHYYVYYTSTNGSYPISSYFPFPNSSCDYCYYNATYGYYYTPMGASHNSTTICGRLYGLLPGGNVDASSNASFSEAVGSSNCVTVSTPAYNSYLGATYYSNDYEAYAFSWYFHLTDTTGLSFTYDSYTSRMYVYSLSFTSASACSKTTLYSSSSFYALNSSNYFGYITSRGFKIYLLRTDDDKLYLYLAGRQHSSRTGYNANEYYCLMRIGPMSLETSSSNPPTTKVIKGVPSSGATGYTSEQIFNIIGCLDGDPDKPIYAILPYHNSVVGGYNGTVTSLASDPDGKAYRLMMPSIMAGQTSTSTAQFYYRYDGINNPWAKSYTLPTCWYNNHLTKMFTCDMARNVYLGDFVDQLYQDTDGIWECPEDGTYKIIMVGAGAPGGASYGGGSGYLKILTRFCTRGEQIPYHIGWGGIYDNGTSNPYAAEPGSPVTWFGTPDSFASGGSGSRGGANGYPSSNGGGGGGYDLVEYGGNGQISSVAPQRNGGQGEMAAIGYGAGGCAKANGADGVIVIVR